MTTILHETSSPFIIWKLISKEIYYGSKTDIEAIEVPDQFIKFLDNVDLTCQLNDWSKSKS
jgi:hypothetical protein